MDALGTCLFEDSVLIDPTNGIEDLDLSISLYEIKLYPNPTSDQINIEFTSFVESLDLINVVVYDNWGRLVEIGSIPGGASGMTTISFNYIVPGIYYVRCFNNSVEKYFKVVKM